MNYLAHLVLADPTPESLMANLMGDYIKGPIAPDWQPRLRDGVILHRRVDGYTDAHPIVRRSAARLSAHRRRCAGIILDICFDHFLSNHWSLFCAQPRPLFIADTYRQLQGYQGYMPAAMQRPIQRMIEQDWLSAYAEADNIGRVLDRVAQRLSQPQRMLGAGQEFIEQYAQLEQDFLIFFPQLIAFAKSYRR